MLHAYKWISIKSKTSVLDKPGHQLDRREFYLQYERSVDKHYEVFQKRYAPERTQQRISSAEHDACASVQ